MTALTADAQAVERFVGMPADARGIVLAGAGCGKTHILVQRATALVETHGVSPGRGVLVLSFTRAAVAMVKERLRDSGTRARAVRPRTFDSLATHLLSELDPVGDWADADFDRRIRIASDLVARDPTQDLGLLEDVEHVLIDEVQDLVGVRADFVVTLLRALDMGFTLFGDPAQAIYGFSARADEESLISRIRKADDLGPISEISLGENHRARTEDARRALWAGDALKQAECDLTDVRERLLDVVRDLPDLGTIDDAAPLLGDVPASTAILCRTNGEALVVADGLARRGIAHALQRAAEDRPVAAWVARAFMDVHSSFVTRSEFDARLAPAALDTNELWAAITSVTQGDSRSANVDRVRRAVRFKLGPDVMFAGTGQLLTVSSIHRSKGLEFDRVLLVEPRRALAERDDLGEETRVLFVALTRARDDIWLLHRPNTGDMHVHAGRWRARHYGGRSTAAIEVRPGDVDRATPPDSSTAARLLAVASGASVTLRIDETTAQEWPTYSLDLDGIGLGRTSETLGRYLVDRLGFKEPSSWPRRFQGARVDVAESVAGQPAASEASGLGPSGLWPAMRLVGLMTPAWDEEALGR